MNTGLGAMLANVVLPLPVSPYVMIFSPDVDPSHCSMVNCLAVLGLGVGLVRPGLGGIGLI